MGIHKRLFWSASALSLVCWIVAPCAAQNLTTGELLIDGGRLEVSPAFQEVDPGRPTVVYTTLGGVPVSDIPPG